MEGEQENWYNFERLVNFICETNFSEFNQIFQSNSKIILQLASIKAICQNIKSKFNASKLNKEQQVVLESAVNMIVRSGINLGFIHTEGMTEHFQNDLETSNNIFNLMVNLGFFKSELQYSIGKVIL